MAKWSNMRTVIIEEIQPGASASLTRTLSQNDIELLALVSGDVDPFHIAEAGNSQVWLDASTTGAVGAEAIVSGVMGPVKASVRYLAHELGPHGIRVHALSPGPIKTRAAGGLAIAVYQKGRDPCRRKRKRQTPHTAR